MELPVRQLFILCCIFVRGNENPDIPSHPTQIYEALAYLTIFALLMWMYWKRNTEERPGLIFGVFLTLLFTARILIEGIKNDLVDFEANMLLNMGQILSIPFVLVGIFFWVRAMIRPRKPIKFPNAFAPESKR